MADNLQMLTPKDVAGILGVHPKTIHLWLRTGKLQGVKISYRAWRISQSALDLFINESSNNALLQKRTANVTSPNNPDENQPHLKMKHYIRDIMGE